MKKLNALIAVRSGSIRVVDKNIRPFCNTTLLENKIRSLQAVDKVDEICVNSNNSEMLKMAEQAGAIPIPRNPEFASNEVVMSDVFVHMAENMNSEHILYAPVTNPLVTIESYNMAIDKYFKGLSTHKSVNTMCSVKEFLWLDGKPINYIEKERPRSQDLPNILSMNHAISILSRETMIKRRGLVGSNPQFLDIGQLESFDIDTEADFFIAQVLFYHLVVLKKKPEKLNELPYTG